MFRVYNPSSVLRKTVNSDWSTFWNNRGQNSLGEERGNRVYLDLPWKNVRTDGRTDGDVITNFFFLIDGFPISIAVDASLQQTLLKEEGEVDFLNYIFLTRFFTTWLSKSLCRSTIPSSFLSSLCHSLYFSLLSFLYYNFQPYRAQATCVLAFFQSNAYNLR